MQRKEKFATDADGQLYIPGTEEIAAAKAAEAVLARHHDEFVDDIERRLTEAYPQLQSVRNHRVGRGIRRDLMADIVLYNPKDPQQRGIRLGLTCMLQNVSGSAWTKVLWYRQSWQKFPGYTWRIVHGGIDEAARRALMALDYTVHETEIAREVASVFGIFEEAA